MRTLCAFLFCAAIASGQVVINGVSPSFGNFTLPAGGCLTQAVTVTGVTTTMMTPTVSPRTFPGNGITWQGYISAADTVTLKVCSSISQFVPASIYDINVATGQGGTVGGVTAVTGTSPIVSSGGATPAISCPTCGTGSVTGVTGTSPIVSSGGAAPVISCPTCSTGASILFSQTATVSLSSNSLTSILGAGSGSTTLPANYFAAPGAVLKIFISGTWNTSANTNTMNFQVSLGGTNVCTGSIAPPFMPANSTGYTFAMEGYITARTVGSSGTIMANIPLWSSATGGTNGIAFQCSNAAATVNTTGTLAVDVKFQINNGVGSGSALSATNVVFSPL